jgi:PTS system beta-glucosides-specific IIC component
MSKQKDYKSLAEKILQHVGGDSNVKHAAHCATRLRLNLNNESLADDQSLKNIDGVLGLVRAGGQLQIIIGQDVSELYQAFSSVTGRQSSVSTDRASNQKKDLSLKSIGSGIMDALSGSLTPAIPIITVAAFFKMITAVFGPDMLGLLPDTSDLFVLMTFVGDAGFYFFPVIIGYTSARKFKSSPLLGILLGAIMLHPTFMGLAAEEASLSVLGIPTAALNYSSTILPIIMSVWVMSYVERFFKKVIPSVLRSFFAPALTILVMLPIALSVLGPLGSFLGSSISEGILNLRGVAGFLGVALIGALFPLLIMTGMHIVLITALIQVFIENGSESFVAPGLAAASFAIMGMALGASLKLKNKDEKSLAWSYFVTMLLAGTSEPALYGIGVRYKKPLIGMIAGGFAGGLYFGILNTGHHTLIPLTNLIGILSFTGYTTANFVNGVIGSIIAFAVAGVVTYVLGLSSSDPSLESSFETASNQ